MSLAAAGESWLSLSEPLWLIALGLCLLPVLWARWSRRRGRRAPRWATAAECLALAMLAVALTGPKAPLRRGARLPWLVLVDASGSVRGQARDDWPALPAGIRTRRWAFAEGLSRRRPASEAATNIGPALRLIASRSRSDTAGAVIATDGRFSDTDWHGAARAVAGTGIETLILPMDAPPPDARVAELTARRCGPRVVTAVTVVANAPVRRTLTVSRAGRADPVFERSLSLLAEAPATFEVSDTPAPDQIARYTARLTPHDQIPENDSAEAAVLPALPTIAAAGPKPLMARWLKPLAREVRLLGAADGLPADPASLAGYAGIVVLDPTGQALGRQQRRALGRFVRSGGGLVLLGTGPSGRPADRDDPLNRVLGLTPDPFRRRPLQLIVLLDHSGSMAREAPPRPGAPVQRKFDLAAEAVVALKDHLTARDALTVITFADEPVVAYSVAGAVDVGALREALSRPPVGSTNVTPALSKALSAPVPDGLKPMLLVLSDLQTERFDPAPWAGKLRQAGAHLAVVAVGRPDPPRGVPPLEALARLTPGAEYFRQDDLSGLAELFARLVRRGRGRLLRQERTALVVEGPLFDTRLARLPDVDAYLLAGKRPQAELLARTTGGEPVLARRQAGLGRSVCLALPLNGHNAAWREDRRAADLISAAARWASRSVNDPRLDVRIRRTGRGMDVTVIAREGGVGVNGLKLYAHVSTAGAPAVAALDQVAPGRYAGSLGAAVEASAVVAIRDERGDTLWQGGVDLAAAREFRAIGADRRGLRQLADLTGGRIVSADRLSEVVANARTRRLTGLWPALLATALLIMLAEWCAARITQAER